MISPFPTGYSARVNPQPLRKFLLGKPPEPPESDYSLAEALELGIIGHVAQELNDPGYKAKGRG